MKIPNSKRKKALIIVDVQPGFLNERTSFIVDKIIKLIKTVPYDLYVDTVFHAEKDSLWQAQQQWILPKDDATHTNQSIAEILRPLNLISFEKTTKSIFKDKSLLEKALKENDIKEVHLVGLDTNDCILASAYEAFDLGFLTYVIEECCQSSSSDRLHSHALELLRHQCMTNNSCIEQIEFITV